MKFIHLLLTLLTLTVTMPMRAAEVMRLPSNPPQINTTTPTVEDADPDTRSLARFGIKGHGTVPSIYSLPYSLTENVPDWKRLWINTGALTTAYVGTLVVLECLPEGSTNWNRATIQSTPWYRRWYQHVIEQGPEWDGDDQIFNYVLHPYAGAVYFMAARSNGFNFYRSLLYSALVSTVGWEFGIEATMERPSIQDIFITPLVGSAVGELFYKLKRHIVSNDYRLFGSPVLGNIVAFIVDPVNELIGLFDGNPARRYAASRRGVTSTLLPRPTNGGMALTFSCTF